MLRAVRTPPLSSSDEYLPPELAKSRAVSSYLTGVFAASRARVQVHLRAAGGDAPPVMILLCALSDCADTRCAVCRRERGRFHQRATSAQGPCVFECVGGVSQGAIAVCLRGHGWATIWSTPVLEARLSSEQADRFVGEVSRSENAGDRSALRDALAGLPVVPQAQLTDIMHGLWRVLASDDRLVDVPVERRVCLSDRALRFIDEHFRTEITAADVVEALGVDASHLGRVFRRATGMTVTGYIAKVRVEKARDLLAHPGSKVTDVALAVGFASIGRFNAVFKRHAGKSPTDIRRSAVVSA